MNKTETCIESYSRLKNLKLVERETGIKWQTVYVHLRKAGVPVTGDKKRYGSTTDKLARQYEDEFKKLVPCAVDNNEAEYQSTIDFYVNGWSVDVKVASLQSGGRQASGKSFSAKWAFCISKQKDKADFFVLFALNENKEVEHVFLVPNDIAVNHSSISIPKSMRSKWADFKIDPSDLSEFFNTI